MTRNLNSLYSFSVVTMKLEKQIQLKLNAERRYQQGKNYTDYSPATQRYVATSPKYMMHPSTLEQSVDDDPLAMMSENRLDLARLKISLLASQIGERRYVHGNCLTGIESDELTCLNEIHKIGVGDYEGVRKIKLEQILRLQKERRDQETSFFRDDATIKKDLFEAILEYKKILKTGEILNGM